MLLKFEVEWIFGSFSLTSNPFLNKVGGHRYILINQIKLATYTKNSTLIASIEIIMSTKSLRTIGDLKRNCFEWWGPTVHNAE